MGLIVSFDSRMYTHTHTHIHTHHRMEVLERDEKKKGSLHTRSFSLDPGLVPKKIFVVSNIYTWKEDLSRKNGQIRLKIEVPNRIGVP